jgi:hypothetical protein
MDAQEILARQRADHSFYHMHSMRRTHDDSADKIAILAGLSQPLDDVGNIPDTNDSVQEVPLSDCFISGTEPKSRKNTSNLLSF